MVGDFYATAGGSKLMVESGWVGVGLGACWGAGMSSNGATKIECPPSNLIILPCIHSDTGMAENVSKKMFTVPLFHGPLLAHNVTHNEASASTAACSLPTEDRTEP